MKRLFIILSILFSTCAFAQDYIQKDKVINGVRNVEAYPAIFAHQTEQYLLAWNYLKSEDQDIESYYLSIMCNDQVAPWNVSAGDKMYLGIALENKYIELTALLDASPESYETSTGTEYRILAYYTIPKDAYLELFSGIDRFKIDVRVKNITPTTLAVKLPFEAIEHMLLSYIQIMSATGR